MESISLIELGAAKVSGMKGLMLVICVLSGVIVGQQRPKLTSSSPLKEYSYPSDGFAVKFPSPTEPYTDSVHSDFKLWTVHVNHGAAISIRLKVDSEPCDAALEKLKGMANAQNETIKELSVSGRPMWEEQERPRGNTRLFERYVCGYGKYYVLTFV